MSWWRASPGGTAGRSACVSGAFYRLTSPSDPLYLTFRLFTLWLTNASRSIEHHLRGAGRPDAARHPCPPRLGPVRRDRTGRAVRDEPAGGLEAPARARARRTDCPRPRGAVAPLPARAGAAQARGRLGRAVSRHV